MIHGAVYPVADDSVPRAVDVEAGMEPHERPESVRERTQPDLRRQLERAAANRSVSIAGVEDDVAVQQALGHAGSLTIEKP